jgi:hypothetical protein
MNEMYRHFLLNNPQKLLGHTQSRLEGKGVVADWLEFANDGIRGSAVLFLVTRCRTHPRREPELCLLLNKRSQQVMQPGDLCCPGGGIGMWDKLLSGLMPLPICSLVQWPRWFRWRLKHPQAARRVMLVLTAGLREAWEEMRLNPLKVFFLGPLPIQQLTLFRRRIFPLAAWLPACPYLRPNREVARIVNVPLRSLLDPVNYGRYRLSFESGRAASQGRKDFPCFIHHDRQGTEILWGATFRIAMDFLKIVFDFRAPDMDALPVIRDMRDEAYLNGSIWDA